MRRRLRLVWLVAACVASFAVGGCTDGDMDATVQVDQSELVGTWTSACGETLTLNDDKTGTLRGFPVPNASGGESTAPTTSSTTSSNSSSAPDVGTWSFDEPEGHPFVILQAADHKWVYQVTSSNGAGLRLIDDTDHTCAFDKKA